MRTALVTGASSGIGAACVTRLTRGGWRVFAGVRSQGDAPEGSSEVLLDVTDGDRIAAAAERIDKLDALVNNAGIAISMPLEFIPLDELRRQLEVNVVGQVAVTQAFLPHLRRSRGRIVFIGSIAGRSALPFLGAYAASKHALEAVADTLRLELAGFGIHVSIVGPGTIRTPIWTKSAALADSLVEGAPGALRELYGERIAAFRKVALKRGESGASADEVARAVEAALTSERPPTRRLVGRDAKLRARVERLPDRVRDRVYERILLRWAEKEER
jgi:NAD(P)-dependent dehydrogenase (short-subunit alcohol dehydrogenase family)